MGRTIAVGDIHGCATALRTMMELIQLHPDDRLITLGDYVDRGPDSREVVDLLLEIQREGCLIPLLGNHELMMLDAIRGGASGAVWMFCGGRETVDSYGGSLAGVPEAHLEFLESCVTWHEESGHLFAHANYDPQLDGDQQPEALLFWQHLHEPLPKPHHSGKIAVVGHTPQTSGLPLLQPHLYCLDTFCFGGGWLTACDLESGELWQTNQLGDQRRQRLEALIGRPPQGHSEGA